MWRGGVGAAYLLPALSVQSVGIPIERFGDETQGGDAGVIWEGVDHSSHRQARAMLSSSRQTRGHRWAAPSHQLYGRGESHRHHGGRSKRLLR
jgi:hypothetical protein